jgi:murein DD-endopeptidase MepM/ murein hydrolase activator NlpD
MFAMCVRGARSGAWRSAAVAAIMVHVVVLCGSARAQPVDVASLTGAERPARTQQADRRIAKAATWHVDPQLLRPRLGDSARTAEARERLALLSVRLRERIRDYDAARELAREAAESARRARVDLRAARDALRTARRQYRARKDLLVSMITTDYASTQLAPLALVLTSGGDTDMLGDLTRLEEMARVQTGAVEAAELAGEQLLDAELELEAAEQRAADELAATRTALAAADQARLAVLADAREAQSVVEESVLADLAARDAAADGYPGAITFPLAAGTDFRDLDNFGGRGSRWASRHTGDDLAAACGSPVAAATGGTVMVRTDQAWSGRWLVLVSTAEGSLTTWYAHMQALNVEDGQWVHAGDPLGQVGQLGNASGCHLHFEVHPSGGGIYEDGIDPAAWLVKVGAYPAS